MAKENTPSTPRTTESEEEVITALEQAISYILGLTQYDQPLDLRLTYTPDGSLCIQPYKEPKEETQPSDSNTESQDEGNHTPSEQKKSASVSRGIIPEQVKTIYMSNNRVKSATALFLPDSSVTILSGSHVNPKPNTTTYSDLTTQRYYEAIDQRIEKWIESGRIKRIGQDLILQESFTIHPKKSSGSALSPAAEFLMRRPVNGWVVWLDEHGNQLPREAVEEENTVE